MRVIRALSSPPEASRCAQDRGSGDRAPIVSDRLGGTNELGEDETIASPMIEIRSQQLDAFRGLLIEQFDVEMTMVLRERFTTLASATVSDVRFLVERGRRRGRRAGIYEPSDVRRFLFYLGHFGVGFGDSEDTAWAAKILADRLRTGTEKIQALDAAAHERGELLP